MYCQLFNLDKYFNGTQIYFNLFDGLFMVENKTQKEIFEELSIISSSYRTQRLKEKTVKNYVYILLEYFKYNDINLVDKKEYEILFSKLYYSSYYKQKTRMMDLLEEVETKIKLNNILKPMLILFKVFIYMNLDYQVDELRKKVESDVIFISHFHNKKYFKDDLGFIFLVVLYNFGIVNQNEIEKQLDNLSISYPKLRWLYHYVKANKAYFDRKDHIALVNYEFLIEEFRRTNNLERYYSVIINASYLYNLLGEYHLCYNLSSSVIEYVFSEIKSGNRIRDVLLHYLFANLMLGRFEEILDFVNIIIFDRRCMSPLSVVICLISADRLGVLNQFDDLMNLESGNVNFNIIKEYIVKKDKKILNNLINFPYYIKIKELLS